MLVTTPLLAVCSFIAFWIIRGAMRNKRRTMLIAFGGNIVSSVVATAGMILYTYDTGNNNYGLIDIIGFPVIVVAAMPLTVPVGMLIGLPASIPAGLLWPLVARRFGGGQYQALALAFAASLFGWMVANVTGSASLINGLGGSVLYLTAGVISAIFLWNVALYKDRVTPPRTGPSVPASA